MNHESSIDFFDIFRSAFANSLLRRLPLNDVILGYFGWGELVVRVLIEPNRAVVIHEGRHRPRYSLV